MNKFQTTDAYTSAARPDQSKRGYVSITMKNKVPQVTFTFWIIKIAATTLGETGGDGAVDDPEPGVTPSAPRFSSRFLWSRFRFKSRRRRCTGFYIGRSLWQRRPLLQLPRII